MVLKMMIERKLMDVIALNPQSLKVKGYIESLKEKLVQKHLGLLTRLQKKPFFYIEVPSGK
jgi:predicted NUDIX family phosphoesterase